MLWSVHCREGKCSEIIAELKLHKNPRSKKDTIGLFKREVGKVTETVHTKAHLKRY